MKTLFETLLRKTIGLTMLAMAIGKQLDNRGFAETLTSYQVFGDIGIAILFIALSISLLELALGLWLVSGIQPRRAAFYTSFFMLLTTGWIAIALARGVEVTSTGGFGIFWASPLRLLTVVESVLLLLASILVFALARKQ